MASSIETIQSVMALRPKIVPIRQDFLSTMRSIENQLNPVDSGHNWRRGVGGSGNNSSNSLRKNQSSSQSLNSRWKGSTSSLSSQADSGTPKDIGLPSPIVKYESRFKNTNEAVEDTILNKIILNKLNKFSPITYQEVRDFLYQILDSGEIEFTKEFMRMVFQKAAMEEMFCPLYAKLLSELRATYPVIQTEMAELFRTYLIIFQNMANLSKQDYATFVSRNIEKTYRMGYSQFLAELVILEAMDTQSFQELFRILIENIRVLGTQADQLMEIQEYTDCLLRMTRVFKKKNTPFFMALRRTLMEAISQDLQSLLNEPREKFPSISPKSRFALMDVRDNLL
jgi:hypothetical protein